MSTWTTTGRISQKSTVADKLRVLVDVNVVLDVLARRQPYFEGSAQVWAAIETGRVDGLLAAHTATTLYDLLQRHSDHARAIAALTDVLGVFEIAPVDGHVLLTAVAWAGAISRMRCRWRRPPRPVRHTSSPAIRPISGSARSPFYDPRIWRRC